MWSWAVYKILRKPLKREEAKEGKPGRGDKATYRPRPAAGVGWPKLNHKTYADFTQRYSKCSISPQSFSVCRQASIDNRV